MILLLLSSGLVWPCGTERWVVKTLADRRAQDISELPVETSIFFLGNLPKYPDLPKDYRLPEELHTYTVVGFLVGYKLEADEDFHIVLADPDHAITMIVEMPAPHCMPPAHQALAGSVRTSFVKRFGQPRKKFRNVRAHNIKLQVTGVGLFDFLHGQTGAAPNGFELHPVTAWREIFRPDGEGNSVEKTEPSIH